MKYSLLLIGLIFIGIFSCTPSKEYDSFGTKIEPKDAKEIKLITQQADLETSSVKLAAIVEEVDQEEGSWMILKNDEGFPIRVTFKDYEFFVPKNIAGKEVIVQGELKKSEMDPLMAQLYADGAGVIYDASKSYVEYSMIAEGVLVEKSEEI
ncbi:DUF4920 domain-containing protein [Marinoscillum sp. MHG1-6]|uniref:DUF4920 domain-containing protein n=1 Tax=Marinoscillum sp. MHG1-6 TaxID=2959627 RepID=UPI0021581867|nr:DUF4920 domain-containing protein [Marinoscillum sp. MHG1-6]